MREHRWYTRVFGLQPPAPWKPLAIAAATAGVGAALGMGFLYVGLCVGVVDATDSL